MYLPLDMYIPHPPKQDKLPTMTFLTSAPSLSSQEDVNSPSPLGPGLPPAGTTGPMLPFTLCVSAGSSVDRSLQPQALHNTPFTPQRQSFCFWLQNPVSLIQANCKSREVPTPRGIPQWGARAEG